MTYLANMFLPAVLVLTGGVLVALTAPPTSAPGNPRELGGVRWGHDLGQALERSRETGKPVLLLFQEIPGCEGCVSFGEQPLSHPLLIEAIEDLFIPIVVRNNQPGEERKILERFGEPASNYPVMRFLNAEARDIVERQESIFTAHQVAKRLIEALATAGRDVPEYLKIAMIESDPARDHRERLTFAMHCFWEGEAKLGAIDGVVATRAAFYDEHEVVDVLFDSTVISIEDLIAAADKVGCADAVYAHGDAQLVHARSAVGARAGPARQRTRSAPASDQQHALAQSSLRFLPLTPMQSVKANSAAGLHEDTRRCLSPRQMALLAKIEAALQRDSKALDGLTRPDSIDDLAAYADELQERLR